MKKDNREYWFYIDDMINAIERIEDYISGLDFDRFMLNQLVIDAVVRNFEIIGEASKNIPEDIKSKHTEIPWKKMYALRNLISHEYFGIDYTILWEIATKELSKNKDDLKKVY